MAGEAEPRFLPLALEILDPAAGALDDLVEDLGLYRAPGGRRSALHLLFGLEPPCSMQVVIPSDVVSGRGGGGPQTPTRGPPASTATSSSPWAMGLRVAPRKK